MIQSSSSLLADSYGLKRMVTTAGSFDSTRPTTPVVQAESDRREDETFSYSATEEYLSSKNVLSIYIMGSGIARRIKNT